MTASITVAIPTYRRDTYLREALESVLAQGVTDLEIVVSDNGNSATTRALVQSYRDSRIAYAPLRENIGLHGNLTRCLHLGSAPYVTVLLDDDVMYPANLESKHALLEKHPTAGMAHSAFHYIDHAGGLLDERVDWTGDHQPSGVETGRQFIERTMALGNRVCMSSAVFRRSAVAQLCHDERDGNFCDLGLSLRVAAAWDVLFIQEPLTGLRIHSDSLSVEDGMYEMPEGGSVTAVRGRGVTNEARAAKLRFINEYPTRARDRMALAGLVRDRARTELKQIVADETLAAKRFPLTARHLYRAAGVEPSLWWSPWSAVLLASSVFGRRLFDTAVEMRTRR